MADPESDNTKPTDTPEAEQRPPFILAFLKAVVFWTVIVFGAIFLASLVIELISNG